jgi:hypothetical protein
MEQSMLSEWIARQTGEEPLEATEALETLWGIVSEAPPEKLPDLVSQLTEDHFPALVTTPLYNQDATERLVLIMDRLNPDPEQAEALANRFPLSWVVSVMGGDAFDVRVLLNGVVLVRNRHRVLGPALWEGLSLELTPELAKTLATDLDTLRARNADGETCCFLMTRQPEGPRLLGAGEAFDPAAPAWGQTIAVCSIDEEDAEQDALLTHELRQIAAEARAGVVFLRFFGDRVDLIPASRFDDDLDIFLEEMADGGLCEALEEGIDLTAPLDGEALIEAIIGRTENDTFHLPTEGPGASWFTGHALRALAGRLASAMTYETVNFGFGPDPDGPRRLVRLPAGVEAAIAADPVLKRRSVTLQVMTQNEEVRGSVLAETLEDRIQDAFEEVRGDGVQMRITGRVDRDLDPDADIPPMGGADVLAAAFGAAFEEILAQTEEDGEEPDDAAINASLGVILLIDFPDDRPSDLTIAAMARRLSGSFETTVRLFLNGRGEYLAYADGEADSGDHELFRLDEGEDDEDE